MVAVTVRHNYEVQLRQIDVFCRCVLFENLRVVTSIEQDALSIVFNECSVAPILLHGWVFSKRIVQNRDLGLAMTGL